MNKPTLIIVTGLPGTGKTTLVDVLARRYHERSFTNRHPGHQDQASEAFYKQAALDRMANGEDQPLELKGKIIIVDTTNFDSVKPDVIVHKIKA
ncbi:MAG TPA: hypothetical protein VNX65_05145 [Patescibacteria group bacterium]|jgi:tRNA uridine 5-carbamoylmethylation protein Kti12|nr:hypothetical protein [Patescibacteria group bacterium]